MEGYAPSGDLAPSFAYVSKSLTEIYGTPQAFNVALNDDVRGVFSRMFAMPIETRHAIPNIIEAPTAIPQCAQGAACPNWRAPHGPRALARHCKTQVDAPPSLAWAPCGVPWGLSCIGSARVPRGTSRPSSSSQASSEIPQTRSCLSHSGVISLAGGWPYTC
jgi:hypothetical protein